MQQYAEQVTDTKGNALAGVLVSIFNLDNSLAALFADDGVTTLGNPVTSDAQGIIVFRANDGAYKRHVTVAGVDTIIPGEITLVSPVNKAAELIASKYRDSAPVLLFDAKTAGSGSRNVVQGHAFDIANRQWYALQLKESSSAFFIRKLKFGNTQLAGNVTEINPASDLIVHQGLFFEDESATRYLWAGGDSGSPIQMVRIRESDGAVTLFGFNPTLTPNGGTGWDGNVTACLNLAKTKLFVRLGRGSTDYVLRYDWASFKGGSSTAVAELIFPIATEQFSGTSFQGLAADEDTIYAMSGNTTQTLNKLLYAYDYAGNIRWKRVLAPHYFESFQNGNKSEVEGIHIFQMPTGQRILTLMTEQGTSGHNVHRMYGIAQFLTESAFGSATLGLKFNDYGAVGVGGVPPSDGDVDLQVMDSTPLASGLAQTTRFGVRNTACVGPTGGGFQMVVSDDGHATLVQRENMPLEIWTNNNYRASFATGKTQFVIGDKEPGPVAAPGPRMILVAPALSTSNTTTTAQEVLRMTWLEGSQDLGAGEGLFVNMGGTLADGTFLPGFQFGFEKNGSSDSSLISNAWLGLAQTAGGPIIRLFNLTFDGFITPLADATQGIGKLLKRWAVGYFVQVFFGAGTASLNSGAGAPETVVTAGVGSIYTDTTNGFMYMKNSGTGNTGWKKITQEA